MTVRTLCAILFTFCAFSAHSFPGSTPSASLKTQTSTRGFHTTPAGQIHYVTGGDFSKQTTLLLLHGHPRSTTEFRGLVDALQGKYAFVALDFFGFGCSDERGAKSDFHRHRRR